MKSTLITAAVFGLISSVHGLAVRDAKNGCNAALPDGVHPGKSVNQTLGDRRYRLHLPSSYDGSKQLPLILSFHGRTQDGKYQEKLSQFSNKTYGFEGIAVYPEGEVFTTSVSIAMNTKNERILTLRFSSLATRSNSGKVTRTRITSMTCNLLSILFPISSQHTASTHPASTQPVNLTEVASLAF
jgi:hypothetical protein